MAQHSIKTSTAPHQHCAVTLSRVCGMQANVSAHTAGALPAMDMHVSCDLHAQQDNMLGQLARHHWCACSQWQRQQKKKITGFTAGAALAPHMSTCNNVRQMGRYTTMLDATLTSYCMARARFVRGPNARIVTSPGLASTVSAMNLAAGVSTATPCHTDQSQHMWRQHRCIAAGANLWNTGSGQQKVQ